DRVRENKTAYDKATLHPRRQRGDLSRHDAAAGDESRGGGAGGDAEGGDAGRVARPNADARRALRIAPLCGLPAVRPGRLQLQIMSAEPSDIHRGLEGVVVDTTRISKVMPEINALVYYGYPVQELAEQCSFEEVAWLIWHGELPNARQLAEFRVE